MLCQPLKHCLVLVPQVTNQPWLRNVVYYAVALVLGGKIFYLDYSLDLQLGLYILVSFWFLMGAKALKAVIHSLLNDCRKRSLGPLSPERASGLPRTPRCCEVW